MTIKISRHHLKTLQLKLANLSWLKIVFYLATIWSVAAIALAWHNDVIVAYGDAESHLNISKRVVHGLTPSLAQLGGIWLPLPHVLILPFVAVDYLWRTGLAGAIISGISYIFASLFLFKLTVLLTRNQLAGFLAFLIFALNPGILYMQATPMTELPLITFFILSSYFYIKYITQVGKNNNSTTAKNSQLISLILAAFFGFCATLTRYDGWFLVLAQALGLIIIHFPSFSVNQRNYQRKSAEPLPTDKQPPNINNQDAVYKRSDSIQKMEGTVVLFATLAFFGIGLWMLWDWLILGDPLYFTNSEFSAKSQQQGWSIKNQLPAHNNLGLSILYYSVTSMATVGILTFILFITGLIKFLRNCHCERSEAIPFKNAKLTLLTAGILMVPFIFYVITLYLGQSVIFIPHLTPVSFEWRLFNVRYGLMMVPVIGIFIGFLFTCAKKADKVLIVSLLLVQAALFGVGYSKNISLADGVTGLSAAKRTDAESWLKTNYDHGLILVDDFARTVSIVRTNIPMQQVIYIGTKPYWEESLAEPEKHARWIILQKNDQVWKEIYEPDHKRDRLFAYFNKVYTSDEILIFRRIE